MHAKHFLLTLTVLRYTTVIIVTGKCIIPREAGKHVRTSRSGPYADFFVLLLLLFLVHLRGQDARACFPAQRWGGGGAPRVSSVCLVCKAALAAKMNKNIRILKK